MKRGRKKINPDNKKTVPLMLYFTKNQMEAIKVKMAETKSRPSSWMRSLVLSTLKID